MIALLLAALSVRPDDVTPTLRLGLSFAAVGLPLAVTFGIHQTNLATSLRKWEMAWAVVVVVCTYVSLISAAFYMDAAVGWVLGIATAVALLFLGLEALMLLRPEKPEAGRTSPK